MWESYGHQLKHQIRCTDKQSYSCTRSHKSPFVYLLTNRQPVPVSVLCWSIRWLNLASSVYQIIAGQLTMPVSMIIRYAKQISKCQVDSYSVAWIDSYDGKYKYASMICIYGCHLLGRNSLLGSNSRRRATTFNWLQLIRLPIQKCGRGRSYRRFSYIWMWHFLRWWRWRWRDIASTYTRTSWTIDCGVGWRISSQLSAACLTLKFRATFWIVHN